MQWFEHWRALAARIEGLVRGAEIFAGLSYGGRLDTFQVVGHSLLPEATDINREIAKFSQNFASILPKEAQQALKDYLDRHWTKGLSLGQAAAVAPMAVLRSRFEYLIRDTEAAARSRIELAFEHLRRLIAVDQHARELWGAAFDDSEPRCERMGAVHLLAQGIWAFKANAIGAATDLVLNEPIQDELQLIERTSNSLVLTEWKLVRGEGELLRKSEEARAQAALYASGMLGPLELKRTRYVVLVTGNEMIAPGDVESAQVVYRHIVLPTKPNIPSVAARKLARATDAG